MPISTKQIKLVDPNFSLQQLYLREKKGRIQHISKNQRCFPDLLKIHGHQMCISNTLYEPSYISLESALRYYNLIPEGVFLTTAVSTKKTQNFSTPAWIFKYQHIAPRLLFGYQMQVLWKYQELRIASPEKALCDYFYLHPEIKEKADFEAMRINPRVWQEIASEEKLKEYAKYYPKTTQKSISAFLFFVHESLC